MHMINNYQKRAFTEVLAAASDMLELMNKGIPDEPDKEWFDAVSDSIDTVGLILKQHHIYLSSKEG